MNNNLPLPSIKRLAIGLSLCFISFLALVSLLYTEPFHDLAEEDGIIESGGALCFLLTGALFCWIFSKTRRVCNASLPTDLGAWFWYLILAVLFFFITGEEISWGQRFFGWATPDWVKQNNIQEETTIHNLDLFNAHTRNHELKPFWQSLLTMNRMFSMFWLAWCLVLPLAVRFIAPVNKLTTWFRVPIPQVFFGCLFFATYVTSKLFVIIYDPEERVLAQTDEIKEAFYAVIFLMLAWDFFKRLKAARNS